MVSARAGRLLAGGDAGDRGRVRGLAEVERDRVVAGARLAAGHGQHLHHEALVGACRRAYAPTASNTAITVSTISGRRHGRALIPVSRTARLEEVVRTPSKVPGFADSGGRFARRRARTRSSLAMSELKSPLPAVIDELWERRAELSPEDSAARAEIVAAVDQIDAGNARVAFVDAGDRRGRGGRAGQARDPARLQGPADGAVAGRRLPLPRPGAAEDPARRGAGGAGRDRPLGRVHRAGHGADALVHQRRRVRGLRARWWTPGRRSARAPRSARTCTCPAASASAACSSRRTRSPSSSRTSA